LEYVLIRHVDSAIAVAFVSYSRLSIQWRYSCYNQLRDTHDVRIFQATLHLNDLSHRYISAHCYGISGLRKATYQGRRNWQYH